MTHAPGDYNAVLKSLKGNLRMLVDVVLLFAARTECSMCHSFTSLPVHFLFIQGRDSLNALLKMLLIPSSIDQQAAANVGNIGDRPVAKQILDQLVNVCSTRMSNDFHHAGSFLQYHPLTKPSLFKRRRTTVTSKRASERASELRVNACKLSIDGG